MVKTRPRLASRRSDMVDCCSRAGAEGARLAPRYQQVTVRALPRVLAWCFSI